MIINNKKMLIEKLTGIHSSKKSYYVELKRIIDEITKRNIQLEIINQLTRSIGIEMPLHEIIENVIHKLQDLVHFDQFSLFVVKENSLVAQSNCVADRQGKIICESVYREYKWNPEGENDDSHSALWAVLIGKEPVLLRAGDSGFPLELLAHKDMAAVYLLPLLVKEKVVGVMLVAACENFNENDLPFLEQVAAQLAVCLENARLYQEVRQRQHEWEVTFAAVTDLLLFINSDFTIQRVNQATVDFFTMPEKEILGKKCHHLFYGRESRCNPCLADQVLRTGKTAYLQSRTRHNRVLDIFAYPASPNGNMPGGITYYAKDVTRFVDSIKFVSLGEMSAGVAHELNSPLTAIVGNSQLLLRETSPEHPHYGLIRDIQSSGVRCQRIIQNLLTFSRQEEFTFEKIDINEVVQNALNLLSYQIEKSNVKLHRELAPHMPLVLGYAQGLEQVVINMILNARDALEEKGRAEENKFEAEITVTTGFRPGKCITVEVRDNGCGIDPASIPYIFNPFFTTKRSGKGTGLGLSVSLGIAQAHGGFIDVESTPGQGSSFKLILPLDKSKGSANSA